MSTIEIVIGDDLPDLSFALLDKITGLIPDLTDVVSCQMRIRLQGATTVLLQLSGYVTSIAAGTIRFIWTLGSIDNIAAGRYEGEIELNHVGGRDLTLFKPVKFKVRQQFG